MENITIPTGTVVQINAWLNELAMDNLLASQHGKLVTVMQDHGESLYVIGDNNDRYFVNKQRANIPTITIRILVEGLPRIRVADCEAALASELGKPTGIDHGQFDGEALCYVEAVWHECSLYPGQTLDEIAWRAAIAAWRGGRMRPGDPIPITQVRMFSNYQHEGEQEHGEWIFTETTHANTLRIFPGLLAY